MYCVFSVQKVIIILFELQNRFSQNFFLNSYLGAITFAHIAIEISIVSFSKGIVRILQHIHITNISLLISSFFANNVVNYNVLFQDFLELRKILTFDSRETACKYFKFYLAFTTFQYSESKICSY